MSSDDTEPQKKMVDIDLSGRWYDDEKAMRAQGAAVRLQEAE